MALVRIFVGKVFSSSREKVPLNLIIEWKIPRLKDIFSVLALRRRYDARIHIFSPKYS